MAASGTNGLSPEGADELDRFGEESGIRAVCRISSDPSNWQWPQDGRAAAGQARFTGYPGRFGG